MSINHVNLTGEHLAQLYHSVLVEMPGNSSQESHDAEQPSSGKIKSLGGHKKKICIVVAEREAVFLKDEFHDAGLFIRRIKNSWKHFETHPFNWITDAFSSDKNIEVIGTPKSIGQAKIAGKISKPLSTTGRGPRWATRPHHRRLV